MRILMGYSKWLVVVFLIAGIGIVSCQNESGKSEPNNRKSMQAMYSGSIVFMNGYIPMDKFQPEDILKTFDLSDESNLNIRLFLDKPLTDHLSVLAPHLSVNELCKQGNYQFTFYLNDEMVYQENLNTQAGTCDQKQSFTVFSVPLASTEAEDSWGRYLWMRFLFRGKGDKVLMSGDQHQLKIEVRPYIMNPELVIGDIIAKGEIELNIIRPEARPEDIAIQPIQAGSGWKVSNDQYDIQKIEELNKRIVEKKFRDIRSIVVIKDDELLLEEYFNNANRSTQHDVRSVGKTFASTMLGIGIDEGYIKNENESLAKFYDLPSYKNYSREKSDVTLRQLLTMSSGFNGNDDDYDSPGNEEYMYPTDDWVRFTLDLGMDSSKVSGRDWTYFTAGVVLLGDIIDKKVPNGLADYSKHKLFDPLGINEYTWPTTPTNVPNTAGGIRLRSLDFAKYGQLYKNGGIWEGVQIIPKEWVNKSLSKIVKRSKSEEGYYGYLFWNDIFHVNGQAYEVSYCTGNGGNKIYIFKDIPFVIVITATAYGRPYAHPQVYEMMQAYILPAVLSN